MWSAGQVGIENHFIRLVDLQSGHFVKPHVQARTPTAQALIDFTRDVFQQYASGLVTVPCLHPNFTCVWA